MGRRPKNKSKKTPAVKRLSSKKIGILAAPKGMHDIFPEEQPWWEKIYKVSKGLADFYNFGKIDTPILEYASIFEKGVGEATDVVEKEMYILKTKSGNRLALRPEGTAGIARAFLENSMDRIGRPQRFFYVGPFFRHENPQLGRYRQFHQLGFEIIGDPSGDPIYDAQIIDISYKLLKLLKIKNFVLKINSIGCKTCRGQYIRQLQTYYKKNKSRVCKDCQKRININPLRLLDCKNEICQEVKIGAPNILNKLCQNCRNHFRMVLEYLDELGIPYEIDQTLVRGFDYYNRTVFEFVDSVGNLGALIGGGRYDYLTAILGGRQTGAVGMSSGIERLISAMKLQGVRPQSHSVKKVFLIHIGGEAKRKILGIIEKLYSAGIPFDEAFNKESLKSQLKIADKSGAELAAILGQQEIFENKIIIRDLKTGLQESIPSDKLISEIKKRLKKND